MTMTIDKKETPALALHAVMAQFDTSLKQYADDYIAIKNARDKLSRDGMALHLGGEMLGELGRWLDSELDGDTGYEVRAHEVITSTVTFKPL